MSIDHFFHKLYNRETYNCAHFVCDVWCELTGKDIEKELSGFLRPPKERHAGMNLRRAFRKLDRPENPCVVLMQRPGTVPHVGVFVRGKVIHIHERGVEFLPLDIAARGFDRLGYYTC